MLRISATAAVKTRLLAVPRAASCFATGAETLCELVARMSNGGFVECRCKTSQKKRPISSSQQAETE